MVQFLKKQYKGFFSKIIINYYELDFRELFDKNTYLSKK